MTSAMTVNAARRKSIICSLLPERSERLIDVGCGPLTSSYPYATKATLITCVDWNLRIIGSVPPNIEYVEGDFTEIDLAKDSYDAIIAADVFEHVPLERECSFVKKCVSVLRPGGYLVVSVHTKALLRISIPTKSSQQSIAFSGV